MVPDPHTGALGSGCAVDTAQHRHHRQQHRGALPLQPYRDRNIGYSLRAPRLARRAAAIPPHGHLGCVRILRSILRPAQHDDRASLRAGTTSSRSSTRRTSTTTSLPTAQTSFCPPYASACPTRPPPDRPLPAAVCDGIAFLDSVQSAGA